MPLLKDDLGPERAEKRLDEIDGSPSLLELVRSDREMQTWLGIHFLCIGISVFLIKWAVDWSLGHIMSGGLLELGVVGGVAIVATYVGLGAADYLACVLSGHNCRQCRRELSRWEGDE